MNESVRYAFDGFVVEPLEQRLLLEGAPVPLEPKVFETLLALLRNAGRLVDKDELMEIVWQGTIVEETNLVRNVSVLRRTLAAGGRAAYIETVPKRGYRFVAPVRVLGSEGSGQRAPVNAGDGAGPKPAPPARLRPAARRAVASTPVLLLVAAAALAVVWLRFGRPADPPVTSVAVLPFVNATGDAAADYLSEGMGATLSDGLARLPGLRVASRSAASRYRGAAVDARAAGRELGVDAVLTGRLTRVDGSWVVRAELMDARDDRHVWGRQVSGADDDLLELQERLLADLAARLRPAVPAADRERLAGSATGSSEAYELFLRGRFYLGVWNEDGLLRSIDYLERATQVDPGYAPAWATLAAAYTQAGLLGATFVMPPREAMPKARAAASRALEIDETLAEAHDALGQIALAFDWDWVRAETAFRDAIARDPRDPRPRHWYSHYLVAMRRFPDSLEQSLQALAIDPLDPGMQVHLGFHYLMAGELDLALAQLQRAEARRPHAERHNILGLVYDRQRRYDRAAAELRRGLALGGVDARGAIGYVYGRAGRLEEAREVLAELHAEGARREVSGYHLAKVHLGLGEVEEAVGWLERAYEERDPNLVYLAADPQLAALHLDPRYRDLLRRLRLPEPAAPAAAAAAGL